MEQKNIDIKTVNLQQHFLQLSKEINNALDIIELIDKDAGARLLKAKYSVVDALEDMNILVDND